MDHWLKGKDTGIMDEPPVKLEIRTGGSQKPYAFRAENEWPLARTRWTKLYLDIQREQGQQDGDVEGTLAREAPVDRKRSGRERGAKQGKIKVRT
jgi:hypothetical protein